MRMINGKIAGTDNHATGSSQIGSIWERWDRAVAEYKATRAELLHSDGTKLYGVREHKTRVDGAVLQLKSAANAARNAAVALRDAAENQRQAAHIDPLLQLTDPAERAEVAYKMQVIKETVEAAALGDLANQLRAMAIHGTRAEQLLFVRYGKSHLQRQHEAATSDNQHVAGLREALDALAELETVASGDALARQKAAVDAAAEAGRLIMRVSVAESDLLNENAPVVDVQKKF